MIKNSFIHEKLKDFNYYISKLPMYLQQSYGFIYQFRIWYDLLVGNDNKGIVGNGEILLNLLNIYDDEYLEYLNEIGDDDILDKIGLLYGITRNVDVSYTIGESTINEQLFLNDSDFLAYIKSRIIQNYCNGTLQQIVDYYNDIKVNSIYVINNPDVSASAKLYLIKDLDDDLTNMDKLFLAGKLKIQSMGISYTYEFLDTSRVLLWDSINTELSNGWGITSDNKGGLWAS